MELRLAQLIRKAEVKKVGVPTINHFHGPCRVVGAVFPAMFSPAFGLCLLNTVRPCRRLLASSRCFRRARVPGPRALRLERLLGRSAPALHAEQSVLSWQAGRACLLQLASQVRVPRELPHLREGARRRERRHGANTEGPTQTTRIQDSSAERISNHARTGFTRCSSSQAAASTARRSQR